MVASKESDRSITFMVKVLPRSSKTLIEGWEGDVLKVRVHAPPVEGKANAALIECLAAALEVPRSFVEILSGENARRKLIRVRGADSGRLKKLATEK